VGRITVTARLVVHLGSTEGSPWCVGGNHNQKCSQKCHSASRHLLDASNRRSSLADTGVGPVPGTSSREANVSPSHKHVLHTHGMRTNHTQTGFRPYNTNGRLRLKCDGTCAETRFRLSTKQTSPFKSAGASVQSTTGSRGVRISGSNPGYTMFRGSVRVLAAHSIRQFPLHFPIRASPSAIAFQPDSTSTQHSQQFDQNEDNCY